MSSFESGVKGYVTAKTVVTVRFPIDWKNNPEVACRHCPYLSSNERMCQLNKQPVAYPQKYVGADCPLTEFTEE